MDKILYVIGCSDITQISSTIISVFIHLHDVHEMNTYRASRCICLHVSAEELLDRFG